MIRTTIATLAILFVSVSSQAAIITAASGTAGTGTTGTALTAGFNAFLDGAPVITTTTPGGTLGNTVTMDLDVYAMDPGESFTVDFGVSDGAGIEGTTTYAFSITLTNMLNANGEDPGDAGKEINGLDIAHLPGPFAAAGFAQPPTPGIAAPLSTFPLQYGGVSGTSLRWGGLSGGGGGVPFGTSQTFTFSLSIFDPLGAGADTTGSLGIVLTANPEPTTFALAGLCLIPAGIAVRRRRRQRDEKAAEQLEAA